MKVLIAMDSFKGSLDSIAAAKAVKEGIEVVCPEVQAEIIPIADGGEGTVDSLVKATGGSILFRTVRGPLGDPVQAKFGLLAEKTAVIEMATASGLTLVPPHRRNPLLTSTYGTGQLIQEALDMGVTKIIIGIGGSATNDAGTGMARALGVRFMDQEGHELADGGGCLHMLHRIDISGLDPRIKNVEVSVACDVQNTLFGPNGASVVYGPQKGASEEQVEFLDKNLQHWARVVKEQLGVNVAGIPGAGAAGGLGAGLIVFAGASLKSGIDTILEAVGFDGKLRDAQLVITGEGRIDSQSAFGKVPVGVSSRANKLGIPVIVLVGSVGPGAYELYQRGIGAIFSIVSSPMELDEAMHSAAELLTACAENVFRLLRIGSQIPMEG